MQMATDLPSSFKEKSCIKMVGYDMSKKAAEQVYRKAGKMIGSDMSKKAAKQVYR